MSESPQERDDAELRRVRQQLSDKSAQLRTAGSQNDRLMRTLKEAREQIVQLRGEIDRLAQPPSAYAVLVAARPDGSVDVLTNGRKMQVAVSPSVEADELEVGRQVLLNEAMNVVAVMPFDDAGDVVVVKEVLDDGRLVVLAGQDEERVVRPSSPLAGLI